MSLKLETRNLKLDPLASGVSIRASRLRCSSTVNPAIRSLINGRSCGAQVLISLGKSLRQGNNAARAFPAHATRFAGPSLRLGRPSAWRRFLAHATRFAGPSLRLGRPSAWRRFLAHATRFAGSSLRLGRPSAWRRLLVSSFQFPVSLISVESATQFRNRHRMGY